ncbi:hypothetical protein Mapa_010303 [Marchantia paleacea]|nr:hypothetical protein Mapa_010303 [Marchantia paleacea]
MWKALGERVTDRELTFMVEELDQNGDEEIDFLEFASLNTTVGLGTHDPDTHAEELRVAFCVADAKCHSQLLSCRT